MTEALKLVRKKLLNVLAELSGFAEKYKDQMCIRDSICRVTKKRIPVVAGTGSNCTETAVYLSAEAEKRGADGLLLVSPYYNKATQKGLMAHFTAVADAVKIPVILYNIPGRTGVTIKPETIAALCRDCLLYTSRCV